MEGMSGHKHDDFAPHGAFLGHAVPVRRTLPCKRSAGGMPA
jgi:hypothetical protein